MKVQKIRPTDISKSCTERNYVGQNTAQNIKCTQAT